MIEFFLFAAFLLAAAIYFFPTGVALYRHNAVGTVAVVNIVTGWSLIGWVIALAIALGSRRR